MSLTKLETKRILFEDEHFIAVHKHAGELVVKDRFGLEKNVLLDSVGNYLRELGHQKDKSGRDLYPVHRLDRDTSGIVLFAKHQEAHRALSILFEGRTVKKIYWTFACGSPVWDSCVCNVPLQRAEGKKGRGRGLIALKSGKPSSTQFFVREQFGDVVWIEAHPHTGRLHQIRLHLKILGHPVMFDSYYGETKWTSKVFPTFPIQRLALHAREIHFEHPVTKKKIVIECPLDEDIRNLLNTLKGPQGQ